MGKSGVAVNSARLYTQALVEADASNETCRPRETDLSSLSEAMPLIIHSLLPSLRHKILRDLFQPIRIGAAQEELTRKMGLDPSRTVLIEFPIDEQ